jgi:hypothetical protein
LPKRGFNVLPLRADNKAPDLTTWSEETKHHQTEQEVLSFTWKQNIGIVNGINDLRTIDIDQCDTLEFLLIDLN